MEWLKQAVVIVCMACTEILDLRSLTPVHQFASVTVPSLSLICVFTCEQSCDALSDYTFSFLRDSESFHVHALLMITHIVPQREIAIQSVHLTVSVIFFSDDILCDSVLS